MGAHHVVSQSEPTDLVKIKSGKMMKHHKKRKTNGAVCHCSNCEHWSFPVSSSRTVNTGSKYLLFVIIHKFSEAKRGKYILH